MRTICLGILLVASCGIFTRAQSGFDPQNPDDPRASNTYRLRLKSMPDGACRFNRSSDAKVEAGEKVVITVRPNNGYVFQGWYDDDELLSSDLSINYLMPTRHVTLTAHLAFSPFNPDEPGGHQDDVDNYLLGDTDRNGVLSVTDVVNIVTYILGEMDFTYQDICDVNQDGYITVADVTALVDIILGN